MSAAVIQLRDGRAAHHASARLIIRQGESDYRAGIAWENNPYQRAAPLFAMAWRDGWRRARGEGE